MKKRLFKLNIIGLIGLMSVCPIYGSATSQSNALLDAVRNHDTAKAQELIKAGADLDQQDKAGKTALIYAITSNQTDIVTELIEAKADLNKQRTFNSEVHNLN